MRMLFRIGLAVSAMAVTLPDLAAAQSAAAFDGTYVGVSGTTGQGGSVNCPPVSTPAPLTISNGAAKSSGTSGFEGTVGPDGRVVLHTQNGIRWDGKIDGGVLKVGGGTSRCTFTFVWNKR